MATGFRDPQRTSTFRRIAASLWGRPSDPTIYGMVDVDVTETLSFLREARARTGRRLTITHVVAHAVAEAFARHPGCNAKVRFGGRIQERTSVDLFVSVAREGGRDLSGAKVEACEALTLTDLAARIDGAVHATRQGADRIERSRGSLGRMPWWLVRGALRVTDLLTNELHLHLPGLGMPRDPFGTAVITNVGGFGIDTAFAPFVPLGRCPMLLLVPEIRERPAVVDGAVVPRPILRLCASFDHRVIDGFQAGQLARVIVARVARPRLDVAAIPPQVDAAASRRVA